MKLFIVSDNQIINLNEIIALRFYIHKQYHVLTIITKAENIEVHEKQDIKEFLNTLYRDSEIDFIGDINKLYFIEYEGSTIKQKILVKDYLNL